MFQVKRKPGSVPMKKFSQRFFFFVCFIKQKIGPIWNSSSNKENINSNQAASHLHTDQQRNLKQMAFVRSSFISSFKEVI